jgi:hypothetical protein
MQTNHTQFHPKRNKSPTWLALCVELCVVGLHMQKQDDIDYLIRVGLKW